MEKISVDVSKYSEGLRTLIQYKLPYISPQVRKVEGDENNLYVHFEADNDGIEEIEEKVNTMVTKAVETYIEYEPAIVYQSKSNTRKMEGNIFNDLLEDGNVVSYGEGLIGFGKDFLRLYKFFDKTFLCWAKELGAEEYIYPDVIAIDTLKKCNYIQQFPNSMLFTSHVKEDMERIEDFSSLISNQDDCLNDYFLEKPKHACKSAVCIHVYQQFEDKKIELENPIAITSLGRCKRYESLNMKDAERLLDFSMREIVFIGTEAFVTEKRAALMERCKELVGKLKLEANIKSSNDPFFLSQHHPKTVLQKKFKLKYELNMRLPYSSKELAVASFNYHNTYFSEAFNIKAKDGSPVHTSCIAFGLERFVYAYLSQKGKDCEDITKLYSIWGREDV